MAKQVAAAEAAAGKNGVCRKPGGVYHGIPHLNS